MQNCTPPGWRPLNPIAPRPIWGPSGPRTVITAPTPIQDHFDGDALGLPVGTPPIPSPNSKVLLVPSGIRPRATWERLLKMPSYFPQKGSLVAPAGPATPA